MSNPLSTNIITKLTLPHFTYIINNFINYIPLIINSYIIKNIKKPSYNNNKKTIINNKQYNTTTNKTNIFIINKNPNKKIQFYKNKKLTNYPIYIIIKTNLKIYFPNTIKNTNIYTTKSNTHTNYYHLKPILNKKIL